MSGINDSAALSAAAAELSRAAEKLSRSADALAAVIAELEREISLSTAAAKAGPGGEAVRLEISVEGPDAGAGVLNREVSVTEGGQYRLVLPSSGGL